MSRLSSTGIVLASVWLVIVVAMALGADWLPLHNPTKQSLLHMLRPPSPDQWLGTDSLGRDVLSRIVHGFRITLTVSFASVGLAALVGGGLGVAAGYFRGPTERIILAVSNVVLAFPPLVLVIALVAYPGLALVKMIIALAIVFTPAVVRVTRASTLSLREREFVMAARAAGMGHIRLILRELLPNLIPPLLAFALLLLAIAALAEAGLSYLGLGVPPPTPTIGQMMASEQSHLLDSPHAVFLPAAALFFTVFALNILGERVQKRIDNRASAA